MNKPIFPHLGSMINFHKFLLSVEMEQIVKITWVIAKTKGRYKEILFHTNMDRTFTFKDLKQGIFFAVMPRKEILKGVDYFRIDGKLGLVREQMVKTQGHVVFEGFKEKEYSQFLGDKNALTRT